MMDELPGFIVPVAAAVLLVFLWLVVAQFGTTVCAMSPFRLLRVWARRADRSHSVAFRIARNPRVTPAELADLATDGNQYIRCLVARHPRASDATIRVLAQDDAVHVRRAIMENPEAPGDVSAWLGLESLLTK